MKAKLGNTIAYIAASAPNPSKTKVLKLLYIMEETMVGKYGVPFLGLPFEVWKMGPVQKDVFVELSDGGSLLDEYVGIELRDGATVLRPRAEFDPDEFSSNELQMMAGVIKEYGRKTAKQLVSHLHRRSSLWYKTATRSGVKDSFDRNLSNNSSVLIDFSELVPASGRDMYKESLLIHSEANNLRAACHV